jgi:hypothetical protein
MFCNSWTSQNQLIMSKASRDFGFTASASIGFDKNLLYLSFLLDAF